MNVAVIDRMLYAHSYLPLFREVSKIVKHNGRLLLYAPKNGGPKSGLGSTVVKHVWTPNFYPFQILRQTLRDWLDIIHIQYELVTFGSLYTSLLFPLLLLLLKLIRVKVVITVHGIFPKSMLKHVLPGELPIPQIILKLYLVFTHKLIDLFGDALIVHSHSMKKTFSSEYKIKRKIYIIPHGFDFEKDEDLSRINLWKSRLDEHRVILFFGYITPRKGVTYLIRAFEQVVKKYPDVRLVIAGDVRPYYKSYGEKVKSLSKKLNLEDKIIFAGFIDERDVLALYSQCDIVALPYEPFIMGTSGTLALAVQNGKPVVATRIPYFEEELKDKEDAVLVPLQDVDYLAKGIESLLVDAELKSRISKNILCKARERSWDMMARLTVDVYAKVMAEEGTESKREIRKLKEGKAVCQEITIN